MSMIKTNPPLTCLQEAPPTGRPFIKGAPRGQGGAEAKGRAAGDENLPAFEKKLKVVLSFFLLPTIEPTREMRTCRHFKKNYKLFFLSFSFQL